MNISGSRSNFMWEMWILIKFTCIRICSASIAISVSIMKNGLFPGARVHENANEKWMQLNIAHKICNFYLDLVFFTLSHWPRPKASFVLHRVCSVYHTCSHRCWNNFDINTCNQSSANATSRRWKKNCNPIKWVDGICACAIQLIRFRAASGRAIKGGDVMAKISI